MTADALVALAIAALGGAAVGLERQASGHADGPRARFAGIRTFTLLGLLGGVAGLLGARGALLPSAALLAGAAGLVVAAYVAASRTDVEATTEVAALVVLAAGTLTGLGERALGSGLVAVTGLLLIEKSRLHAWAARVDDEDLRAGLRFAAMALVVLPLLPTGPFGPGAGVRPRELWALVLFFSGLSFAGHIARRVLGSRHGLLMAGLLGGLVSSTSVTWTFARQSRTDAAAARTLAAGALAANVTLVPRVLVAATVLDGPLAWALLPWVAGAVAVVVAATWWAARGAGSSKAEAASGGNPLQLGAALQMVVLFQAVLWGVDLARRWFGSAGVVGSGAVLGLTDMDALTATMARGADAIGRPTAVLAIVVGMVSNTLLKTTLAVAIGHPAFKRVAGLGLLAMALALAVPVLWFGDDPAF